MDPTAMDPNKIPVVPPPPGIETNFVNPETLMPSVIAGTVVIQFVALTLVLARLVVNGVSRTFRIEDLFCYIAWAVMIAQATLVVYASAIGCARHAWDIPLAWLPRINQYYNYILCCWTMSGYFARTFIFLQFKRIFTTSKKGRVYWVIMISIAANTILYAGFLFAYVFSCWPRKAIWDPMTPGKCVDTKKLQYATGVLNIISDVEAFIVPLWAVWSLQMKLQHKLQVFAVFSIGAVAVAIACTGLYFRVHVQNVLDFSWVLTQLAIVCMAELGSLLVLGCATYVPRLLRWNQLRGKSLYSGGYSDKPSQKKSLASQSKAMSQTQSSTLENGVSTTDSDARSTMNPLRQNPAGSDGIMKTTKFSQSTGNLEHV